MATTRRKLKSKPQTTCAQSEWAFGQVPDSELDSCYHYEFLREAKKEGLQTRFFQRYKAALPFVEGNDPLAKKRILPPWLELDARDRTEFANIVETANAGVNEDGLIMDLERHISGRQPFSLATVRGRNHKPRLQQPFTLEGWKRARQDDASQGEFREYGFFAIDWSFPPTALINEFKRFISAHAPHMSCPKKSQRGKAKDKAALLKGLGAKRLLSCGFSAAQALAYTKQIIGLPLYQDTSALFAGVKLAVNELRQF